MPDKRRKDGKRCLRCWRNKLKHGNKLKKVNGGRGQESVKEILAKDVPRREKIKLFKKSDYFVHPSSHKVKYYPWKFKIIYDKEDEDF